MRKFMTVLAVLALVVLVAAPVMAQDRPGLADFLVEDGRFNTLLAAVGAAGLTDALGTEGPITVLAPTDDAFAALPLGAVDFLLRNPEVLAGVLTSHVIPGEAYTLREIAGGATVDSFSGEPVTFALADGVLTANGVVISSVDKLVSNGVVHILDGVIVPAAAAEALAAATSQVRVAHFSPDGGAVNVAVEGNTLLEGVEFGTISDWVPMVEGVYSIRVSGAGENNADLLRTITTRVPGGAHITVAARGIVETGDFALQFIPEDFSSIGEGQARVTVFHAIQNAPAVDVRANGAVVISNLGYPGTLGDNDGVDTVNVAAATYNIQVVPFGATEPVILDLPGVTFAPNTNYFVAAIGTPTSPSFALVSSPGG
jgi:uncharacterized surface protein with fasciclin (FAS1) repeats